MNNKVSIARLSVFSNSSLILLKLLVGLISGSVSIMSEAIHSFMDLLASIIAFFSVKISETPADARHPYGHGKFENISGVFEAILILGAACWIILEAVKKLIHPHSLDSFHIGLGFAVMAISAIVNIIVSKKLYRIAKETDSIALEADALHLKADVYTSIGVAAGLLLMFVASMFTGSRLIALLDPVIAILVALLILKESVGIFMKAYEPLLDAALPHEEIETIRAIIDRHCTREVRYHNLRTRKSGNIRYVDFHLNLNEDMTVKKAHEICDTIENDIKSVYKDAEVTIHVENF
jgi:cation diffusion facilitator family transporter